MVSTVIIIEEEKRGSDNDYTLNMYSRNYARIFIFQVPGYSFKELAH